jgi:peptide/nickel transport system permease protein
VATHNGNTRGTFTVSRRGIAAASARALSIALLSVPPLVMSFGLLLLAALTGWFPVGGYPSSIAAASVAERVRHLVLPTLALALPIAASLERLHSTGVRAALAQRPVLAARARGIPGARLLWLHAMRLSLVPLLAVYGLIVGTVLSGSFAVEIVMAWPGLGSLMYEALVARDRFLVAGCAAAVSAFLALGVLSSDIAVALPDPRLEEES